MIDETGNVYGKLKVIERDGKKGSCIAWKCLCECGNYTTVAGTDLRRGHTTSCGCKGGKNIDITNQRFGKLVALYPTDKKSGSATKWHCKCDCGNECDISINALRQNNTKSCGCLHKQKTSETNKNNIIGKRFGLWTVLEELPERNENKKIVYKCKCDCGTIKEVIGGNLINKKSQSCGCLKMSHGELKIYNLLKENNIDFIQEYHPKNSNLFQNGRYDFYIPPQKILIEYDGKQHFQIKGSGWDESLDDIQRRDSQKNEWALKNGYTLIRIPYTHYDSLCIKDLTLQSSFIFNN